jgi:hypothetical protein
VEYLEWADAEKTKGINELEKKYQGMLDLNKKEYAEAQKEVVENLNAHLTCLDHYLDLFHLCNGKWCNGQEPINHTKQAAEHFLRPRPAHGAGGGPGRPRDLRPMGFRPCIS